MSKLTEFVTLEQQMKKLQQEMEALKSKPGFEQEIEFKTKLEDLMNEYDKSKSEVITLLDPKPEEEQKKPGTRRKRKLKTYKNPHTGEEVQTRGGNHKILKEWKAEYGDEEVEKWVEKEED